MVLAYQYGALIIQFITIIEDTIYHGDNTQRVCSKMIEKSNDNSYYDYPDNISAGESHEYDESRNILYGCITSIPYINESLIGISSQHIPVVSCFLSTNLFHICPDR